MLHQQVSVNFWSMAKAMLIYGVLTAMCWLMLRLFNAVFTLPRRLRHQQENIQNTLEDLQKRFPELNITEDDLKNAEKDLEDFLKEEDEKQEVKNIEETPEISQTEENKFK